jgi:hypothetical protein
MLSLLITLIVAALVIYVISLILNMITLPAPVKNLIYVVLGIIVLLWLLGQLGLPGPKL